jgi:hypothetical protein
MPIVSTNVASPARNERAASWLIFTSDCNGHPPPTALLLCWLAHQAQRLIQPSQHEAAAPNQRATPPSIGSLLIS